MNASGFRVRVPGSSANLGPGFDSFAVALDLVLELEVRESDTFEIEVGELDVPLGRENLCVEAFESLKPADAVSFKIGSRIPLAGGLGSSAAATVAGLLAADRMFDLDLDDAEILRRAAEIEGHVDNAAASIHGGFVISDPAGDGTQAPVGLDIPRGVEAVLVVPTSDRVPTSEARGALPDEVPLREASANIAAAATLALGIERSDLDLISRGLVDRLHQERREHLYPKALEIVSRAKALGALGATVSGAGPSVLVWCDGDTTEVVIEALDQLVDGWGDARKVGFSVSGAEVSTL